MASLKLVPIFLLLTSAALARTYDIGRAPTAAEFAQSITIGPTGAGLPTGRGTAARGAALFKEKGCIGCHGANGVGGVTSAPNLQAKKGPEFGPWDRMERGGGIPVKAPNAIIVWDFIHRGMPLGNEGTVSPDEAYSLTAYLLALNKIIPESQVLDQNNLAKIKMPIGNDWARVPDWKPKQGRFPGYPY